MTGQKFRTTATSADQDWAASHLELCKEAPHSAQRGQILERLEDLDFMPPSDVRDAVSILAEGTSSGASVRSEERTLLIEQLNGFVRAYWQLPVFERQKQYQHLVSEAGAFPEIGRFLDHLEAGLAVDATRLDTEEDADVHDLGRAVCSTFLAGQAARVEIRRRWQSEYSLNERRGVARRLSSDYPAVAALDDVWIQRLLREESHYVPRKKLLSKVVRRTSQAIDHSVKGSGNGSGFILIVVGIALGVVSPMLRSCSSVPDHLPPYEIHPPRIEVRPPDDHTIDPNDPGTEDLRQILGEHWPRMREKLPGHDPAENDPSHQPAIAEKPSP